MKKLLILLMISFSLTACQTMTPVTATPTVITQAQNTALASLEASGAILQAAPGITDALYNAGKISKETYNGEVLPVYNKAIASYKLVSAALQAAVTAGTDPNKAESYMAALTVFMSDQTNLTNLLFMLQTGGVK